MKTMNTIMRTVGYLLKMEPQHINNKLLIIMLCVGWALCAMPSWSGELMTIADYELVDSDGDGIPNVDDNAPEHANPDQTDDDGDYIGLVIDMDDHDKTNGGAEFSASIGGPYSMNYGDDLLISNISAIYSNTIGILPNYYEFYFDFDDDTVWDHVATGVSPIVVSNSILQNYNLHTTGSHSVDVKVEPLAPGPTYLTLNYEVIPEPPPEATIYRAVEIGWSSDTGTIYQVQYSTNLVSTNWFDLGTGVMGNGLTNYTFDSTRESGERFYRIITVP